MLDTTSTHGEKIGLLTKKLLHVNEIALPPLIINIDNLVNTMIHAKKEKIWGT